jgi:hypothetical protein
MPVTAAEGSIRPDVLYTVARVKSEIGWGQSTLREARDNGLRVIKAHGRLFILGQDLIDYLEQVNSDPS